MIDVMHTDDVDDPYMRPSKEHVSLLERLGLRLPPPRVPYSVTPPKGALGRIRTYDARSND